MSRGKILRGAAFGLALLVPLALRAAGPEEALHVGTITIRTENVFSKEEEDEGRLYQALNRVRIKTNPDVIRKFLLFREGEPFEKQKLEETERNLRTLPFLKAVSVTAGEPHEGAVDILVVTQDRWTLLPGVPIASNGGTTTYGLQVLERDFLGTGREISFAYNREIERLTRVLSFTDPNLFGAYWAARVAQGWNSDGNRTRAEVIHPFVSLVSPSAHRAGLDVFGQTTRFYADGDVSAAWHQTHREVAFEAGWALAVSEKRAQRISAGLQVLDDRFETLPERPLDVPPDPRTFRTLFVGYELAENDLLKLDYVNRDLAVEDFNLGKSVSARLGLSPPIFGAPGTTGFVRLRAAGGARLAGGGFALAAITWETRLEGGLKNEIVSATLDFVHKLRTKHPQTFVAKARVDQGWNLDRDVQFIADGLYGLRGYRLFSFAGDKRAIVNLEQRAFLGREIWNLFSPGVAFFLDSGTAAPPGTPLRPSTFRTDVGFGLRMSISRAPGDNVYRIDFAYALDPDPKGRKGLLVSFSASQGF